MRQDRFTNEMKRLVDIFFDFFGKDAEKYAFVLFTHIEDQKELIEYLDIHEGGRRDESDDEDEEKDWVINEKFKEAYRKYGNKIEPTLKGLIDRVGGNVLFINNKTRNKDKKRAQVDAIFKQVSRIQDQTGQAYFSSAKFLCVDRLIEIEKGYAQKAKARNDYSYKPWAWIKENESNNILEKVLDDTMQKERQENERKKKEREDFEQEQLKKENEFQDQIKRMKDLRESEIKEWEEKMQQQQKQRLEDEQRWQQLMKEEKEKASREMERADRDRKEAEERRQNDDEQAKEERERERKRVEAEFARITQQNELMFNKLVEENRRREQEFQLYRQEAERRRQEYEKDIKRLEDERARERERARQEFESRRRREEEEEDRRRKTRAQEERAHYDSIKQETKKDNWLVRGVRSVVKFFKRWF